MLILQNEKEKCLERYQLNNTSSRRSTFVKEIEFIVKSQTQMASEANSIKYLKNEANPLTWRK